MEAKSALVRGKTIACSQSHPEARPGEAETRLSPGRGLPSLGGAVRSAPCGLCAAQVPVKARVTLARRLGVRAWSGRCWRCGALLVVSTATRGAVLAALGLEVLA